MKLMFVLGTRPEAIKLAPVIRLAKADANCDVIVCATAQHRDLLDQVVDFFGIRPDVDLGLMRPGQGLSQFSGRALNELGSVISDEQPDVVVVQGDTSTVLMGSIAAFYARVQIAHVEAGLRTNNLSQPWPEEGNRAMVGQIATYHFAPTTNAARNLANEGITTNVYTVGNTVVDALLLGKALLEETPQSTFESRFQYLCTNSPVVLVTLHRRESFDRGLADICAAIAELANERPSACFVFPVHPNPAVRDAVYGTLQTIPNVYLEEPFTYPEMLFVMQRCSFVLTDSGGIQEEAPTLGKPVLVARAVTERPEGVQAGVAKIVGTSTRSVLSTCRELLDDPGVYKNMSSPQNPYGDGLASERILSVLRGEVIDEFS